MKNKLKPCRKCNGTDLEKNNCGYSSFDVAWVKCKTCGHEVKRDYCSDASFYWNEDKARITLDLSFFEHLLNCMYHYRINNPSHSEGEEELYKAFLEGTEIVSKYKKENKIKI
ncbi:MAG TPA: hypothetical protein VMZ91_06120 [Candidatus Paceibacterota bacterium]|nr:hypothetical protein [Candidatus Paceibacterota bacterium]